MGEVYKATDTRLQRVVAIKVIRDGQVEDVERVRRFESEARAAAALNHPNILTVHDVGVHDGAPYIVSELLEGETLAALLEGGALPVRKAVDIALQVAHGLAAAHDKGIVHRDLKPSNLWLTRDGRVKILDFGLAKLTQPEPGAAGGGAVTRTTSTSPGTVVGTVGYMAPEQVRGEPLDARSDLFAWGAVLYEMLSGRRAFDGATAADVMSAILRQDPAELSSSGTAIPPALERIVRQCLEKRPEQRFRSLHDLALALEAVAGVSSAPASVVSAPQPRWLLGGRIRLVLAFAAVALGVFGLWSLRGPGSPGGLSIGQPVARFQLPFPDGTRFADSHPSMAISRDGTTVALVARGARAPELYIRALQGWEWKRVPATEGAASPFFSPDGKWLAFFSAGKLRRVSIAGGTPQVICDAAGARALLPSGTWGEDGQILFWTWPEPGLWRVSPAGGVPEPLKGTQAPQHLRYRRPYLLPGGRHVLFGVWSPGSARVEIMSLETTQPRTLIAAGSDPSYASPGHLVFGWDNQILAVPFDVRKLEIRGVPVPLVEGVRMTYGRTVAGDYALSEHGTLVYAPGQKPDRRLVWVDHRGRRDPLPLPTRGYAYAALSPGQDRVAVTIADGPSRNIWIGDLSRGTLSRLTADGDAVFSLWTPDEKYVLFTSSAPGQYNIFRKRADGGGEAERLTVSTNPHAANSISPDGKVLLFQENDPTSHIDLWQMRLEGEPKPMPLLKTAANERLAAFSPDGRWVAYDSDDSGQFEVYVQLYPGPGQKKQVSTDGGKAATWSPNGRELFFYADYDQLMSASFEAGPPARIGKPRPLFRHPLIGDFGGKPMFDVSADGQRFLMINESVEPQPEPRLNLVLNWFDELRRRVPAH